MIKQYEPLYTVKEVSEILKTGVGTVYALINSGKLPSLDLGAAKIRGIDLEEFINSQPANTKEL